MPANNEIITALPVGEAADKEVLRQWAVTRVAYCLAPSEDSRDFVAVDPAGAGTSPALIQNGLVYGLDDADTTTDHDGVTCLVSYDSKRYKLEAGTHVPYNVLDKDLTAPPVSPAPSYGDAYLIYGTPTGTWAGQAGKIAIFTARGWSYATAPLGFLVFAKDENAYYHRDSAGAWTLGTGVRTLGANSVIVSNAVGFGRTFTPENQTTKSPPASPSTGDTYVIAPSATGDWLGLDGKIAICEDGATFTVYTPGVGWSIYDKAQNTAYTWNGTTWRSSVGVWIDRLGVGTSSGSSTLIPNSLAYNYSSTTPPTTSNRMRRDDAALNFAAKKTGATLRFHYTCDVTLTSSSNGSGDGNIVVAIFRDSETNAIAWQRVPLIDSLITGAANQVLLTHLDHWFYVQASDASAHTYKAVIISRFGIGAFFVDASEPSRRIFDVEESA